MKTFRSGACRLLMPCIPACLLAASLLLLSSNPAAAQTDGPSMSNVNDVLAGQTLLFPQEDQGLLVTTYPVNGNNNILTQFYPFTTSNSQSTQQSPIDLHNNDGVALGAGVVSSAAMGRMFNNSNDVVISVVTGYNSSTIAPAWAYNYYNPATKANQGPYTLAANLEPNGTKSITSRVIMGNFRGNLLSDALIFVESDFGGYQLWGMNLVTVPDVNKIDVIDPYGGGPQYSTEAQTPSQLPVASTIVAGDFDSDGIDEIAMLMNDGQTIQLFKVNPQSLNISPYKSFTLPTPLSPSALVAGHFGTSANVVLAAIGQISNTANIAAFYIDPSQQTPFIKQTSLPSPSEYDGVSIQGFIGQAAPVVQPVSNISEQLVVGLQYLNPPNRYNNGIFWVGTFNGSGDFNLQNESDLIGSHGCLLGMKVSNFNNIGSGNVVQNAYQVSILETYAQDGGGTSSCLPPYVGGYLFLATFDINVPSAVAANPTAPPTGGVTSWTSQVSYKSPDIGPYSSLQGVQFLTGDLQGRSLRLGSPEKITLTKHIQPNIVLGMAPMHVDWINPLSVGSNNCEPNTLLQTGPECILNLTVKPYGASADQSSAFGTGYQFNSGKTVTSTRKSATSWGLSAKITVGASFKYSIPEESSGSASITSTTSDSYKNVSSAYDKSYQGTSESLSAQTGFDDYVFFTSETQNIYHYPVLGQVDNAKNPLYITFSVPSSVEYKVLEGTTLEWYQPAHEAGNVLSYPATDILAKSNFSPASKPPETLAASPFISVGSGAVSADYSWNTGDTQGSTAGWSDALSSNLNISASYSAGGTVFGAGAKATISGSVDVGGSGSWSALNDSSHTLSSGVATNLKVPQFDKDLSTLTGYQFQDLVFGNVNPENVGSNGTYQGSLLPSQQNGGPQIQGSGPLFVTFSANPFNGGGNWWNQAYLQPDIGFNHPSRWDVSTSNQVSFNSFSTDKSQNLLDQLFYHMKGFWITSQGQAGDPTNIGMTMGEAKYGDQLNLTVRVYNFSPVPIGSGNQVHLRVYGQKVCGVDVCNNGSFLIPASGTNGDYVFINPIPEFNNNSNAPNFAYATIPFDTGIVPGGGADDAELVFWVVAWIQDANGQVVAEVPDHGITAPQGMANLKFANINDVPMQAHSNNVGMYGTQSFFYLLGSSSSSSSLAAAQAPAPEDKAPRATSQPVSLTTSASATTDEAGPLASLSLSFPERVIPVDHKTKLSVFYQAGKPFPGSSVNIYDGNPARGGKLVDFQTLHRLKPGVASIGRTYYRPTKCGRNTLYAVSYVEGFEPTIGKTSVVVDIDPVDSTQSMIRYLRGLVVPPQERWVLLYTLRNAQDRFRQGQVRRAMGGLAVFDALVRNLPSLQKGHLKDQMDTLVGDSQRIRSCEAAFRASRYQISDSK